MIKLSLLEIAQQLNYLLPAHDAVFTGISTDTRTIQTNNLYVAIRGEQFDGHTFIEKASQQGAIAALVDHPMDCPIPQLIAKDTIEALGKITALWRNQFSLPIIGVTGSNGKTTLKNMLANILLAACKQDPQKILATEGNLNNHIGLPLMLARLSAQHQFAVLEMGMNHFNEIAYLTQLAKPSVAVITNAAECHLEGVGDVAGVARAKGEIFLGLTPGGTAVLNADDAHFNYWKELTTKYHLLSFGLENKADVTATLNSNHIIVHTPSGQEKITLTLLGIHNIMNALAATASALALNIDLATIKQGLENTHPTAGRLQEYRLANGVKIIDDTYNANPFSTKAAIHTLASMPGTKILILGDMKELGNNAEEFHTRTGQVAHQAGIQHLFTYGNMSKRIAEGFGKNAEHFTDREELLNAVQPFLQKDVTVLIKGSRAMEMEYFVKRLVPKQHLKELH
jgi:UDP-N-acetylmuramoyl-tripeptide--D-alanyl-D-alanine ligase